MDKMKDSKGTPTKGSSTRNGVNSGNDFRSFDHSDPEIKKPTTSADVPSFPDEMPT